MRNNTKLKHLLLKYTVAFNLDMDEVFSLSIIDKIKNDSHTFEGKSYSVVLSLAYKFLSKEIKSVTQIKKIRK